MLPEPSGTFLEPPIMSAPLFSIPIIPIRNSEPLHPQARIGLGFASGTSTSIPLAVHLTRSRIGTLGNLPSRSRTCPDVPSVTQAQSQILTKNLPQVLGREHVGNQPDGQAQQQHNMIQSDQLQQRQPANVPPSFLKADFTDSSKFSGSIPPVQNILGSLCPESSANLLNFSRTGQLMLADQLPQQSWAPKYTHSQVNAFTSSTSRPQVFPGKDAIIEPEIGNSDAQNSALFGVNNNSYGLLLPTTMPGFATSSSEADVPSIPLGNPSFQNPLYGSMQDTSELQSTGQVDPLTPTRTFVNVYKSGSH